MRFLKYVLFLVFTLNVQAQSLYPQWKSYFSYADVTAVTAGDDEVFATTTNAVLIFNVKTQTTTTFGPLEGLRLQRVTALHYSEKFKKIIIGNEDGSIQIIDRKSGKVSYLDDILNKQALAPSLKVINAFTEFKGALYLATNYGISVLNLNNNQFLDTYYIGSQGGYQKVNQVAILNQTIYAATATEGLKKASITNPNLVDYAQWVLFDGASWDGLVAFENKLVGVKEASAVYEFTTSGLVSRGALNGALQNMRVQGSVLVVTSNRTTAVFNAQLNQIGIVDREGIQDGTYLQGYVYLASAEDGLIRSDLIAPFHFEELSPDGPLSNRVFSMLQTDKGLWFVFGGYSRMYNPHEPALSAYGLSRYSAGKGWEEIPYSRLKQAKALAQAQLNPRNKQQLWVSSFHSGLLKIELDEDNLGASEVTLYNENNTGSQGLESLEPSVHGTADDYVSVRINGVAFDFEGNAWMTNSMVSRNLKERTVQGNWSSYSFANRLQNTVFSSFGAPIVDKNGTKWIPSLDDGLIGFNEKKGDKIAVLNMGTATGNLPDLDVRSLAIDQNNQLWIGTYKGLRVLSSVDRFLGNNSLNSNNIVIKQDGLAEELFYQQSITKIKVDGANNKWVAIADAGVFLLTPNGQETLHHFTKANAPLPSNTITDIEIDGRTGEVFFATEMGVVSYKGEATSPTDSYEGAYIYPNPVRPEFLGTVKISGLMDQSNVKITDVTGNLVFETTSRGGTVNWDTYSFSGRKVKSGVYLVLISSQDGSQKTVKKLMIIR